MGLRLKRYLEVVEAKLAAAGQFVEGTLTMFAGVPFGSDSPYTYLEAKRILGLAMGELRQRKDLIAIGMDPALSGRTAITGSRRVIWSGTFFSSRWHKELTSSPNIRI